MMVVMSGMSCKKILRKFRPFDGTGFVPEWGKYLLNEESGCARDSSAISDSRKIDTQGAQPYLGPTEHSISRLEELMTRLKCSTTIQSKDGINPVIPSKQL